MIKLVRREGYKRDVRRWKIVGGVFMAAIKGQCRGLLGDQLLPDTETGSTTWT